MAKSGESETPCPEDRECHGNNHVNGRSTPLLDSSYESYKTVDFNSSDFVAHTGTVSMTEKSANFAGDGYTVVTPSKYANARLRPGLWGADGLLAMPKVKVLLFPGCLVQVRTGEDRDGGIHYSDIFELKYCIA